MKVKEIVTNYLKENGFDGLMCPYVSCGCGIDDLAPCAGDFSECEPAYCVKRKCSECQSTCDGFEDTEEATDCFTTSKPDGR